jgi:hypothetical protein
MKPNCIAGQPAALIKKRMHLLKYEMHMCPQREREKEMDEETKCCECVEMRLKT